MTKTVVMSRVCTSPLTGLHVATVQSLAGVVGTVLLLGAALGGAGQRSCQVPGAEAPIPPPTMTRLTATMARVVTGPLTGFHVATVQSLVGVFRMVLPLGTALGGAGQRSCQLLGAELLALLPQTTQLTVMMARVVTGPLTGLCMETVQSLREVVGTVLPLGVVLAGAGQRSC